MLASPTRPGCWHHDGVPADATDRDVVHARLEALVESAGGRAQVVDRTDAGSGLRVLEVVPEAAGAAGILVEYSAPDEHELWITVADWGEHGDLGWLALLVPAVAAGRIRRLDGSGRHRVEIEVGPGDVRTSTSYDGLRAIGPCPRWRQRAALVEFAPYG